MVDPNQGRAVLGVVFQQEIDQHFSQIPTAPGSMFECSDDFVRTAVVVGQVHAQTSQVARGGFCSGIVDADVAFE